MFNWIEPPYLFTITQDQPMSIDLHALRASLSNLDASLEIIHAIVKEAPSADSARSWHALNHLNECKQTTEIWIKTLDSELAAGTHHRVHAQDLASSTIGYAAIPKGERPLGYPQRLKDEDARLVKLASPQQLEPPSYHHPQDRLDGITFLLHEISGHLRTLTQQAASKA